MLINITVVYVSWKGDSCHFHKEFNIPIPVVMKVSIHFYSFHLLNTRARCGFFFFIQSKFFLWKSLEIDVWRDRWSLLGDGLTGTSIRVSALGTDWPEHLSERPHWGRIDRHIYQSVSIGYLHGCDYQQSSFSAVPYDVITFIIFLFRDDMLNLQHTTHI